MAGQLDRRRVGELEDAAASRHVSSIVLHRHLGQVPGPGGRPDQRANSVGSRCRLCRPAAGLASPISGRQGRGECAWMDCRGVRVRGVAYCLDHLWESCARRLPGKPRITPAAACAPPLNA